MTRDDLQRNFLLALVLAAVALTVVLILPFWSSLLVAAVLAAAANRPMAWLSAKLRDKRSLAAAILVVVLVVALALPVASLVTVVAGQAVIGFQWLREALASQDVSDLIASLPAWLEPLVRKLVDAVPDLEEEIRALAGAGGGQAVAALGGLLSATGGALLRTGITLIAFFFFLTDGHRLISWLESTAPMAPGQFRELAGEFRRTAVSVLVATLATAGIQAAAALVGFLIARVPGPLFLTFVAFIVALIPAVGGSVLVLAVALLQYATGHPVAALFLAVWGVVVVSMVDNLARPFLLKDGMDQPVGLVFLALLGGVAAFGAVGLLLGPLVVTFLIAALRIWRRDQDEREPLEGAEAVGPGAGQAPPGAGGRAPPGVACAPTPTGTGAAPPHGAGTPPTKT